MEDRIIAYLLGECDEEEAEVEKIVPGGFQMAG